MGVRTAGLTYTNPFRTAHTEACVRSVMQSEHDLSSLYPDGTDAAIECASRGDANALRSFAQHGQSFVGLVKEHTQREDRRSFPLANRLLAERDQKNLLAKVEKIDDKERAAGTHDKYVALANRFADRFDVSQAATVVVIA